MAPSSRRSTGLVLARAFAGFCALVALYYAFAMTELYRTHVFSAYARASTRWSGDLLALLGFDDVRVNGLHLGSSRFGVQVAQGCDGLEPLALFLAALLAFPGTLLLKLPALLLGVPALVALNLLRIASLYLVGLHYPRLFYTVHTDVWQALYVVAALGCFGVWLAWATSRAAAGHADPR